MNYLVILWVTPVADNVRKTHIKICIYLQQWVVNQAYDLFDEESLGHGGLTLVSMSAVLSEDLRWIMMIIASRTAWLRKLVTNKVLGAFVVSKGSVSQKTHYQHVVLWEHDRLLQGYYDTKLFLLLLHQQQLFQILWFIRTPWSGL